MCVYGSVTCSTGQILSIPVWNMLSGLWIPKPLCKTEVNHVHVMLLLADTYQEIVRLYVPVKEMTRVYELNSLQHLVCKHQHRLEGELALAVI